MNRRLLVIVLLCIICAPIGGRPADTDPAAVVRWNVESVRRNIGGECGTPDIEAHRELVELGKPAVPYLIESLEANSLPQIDSFIGRVLSDIFVHGFTAKSHDALVAEVEEWWNAHQHQTEQDWILDAMERGEERDLYKAATLTRPQDRARLKSFLKSGNHDTAWFGVYYLWDHFRSPDALAYVKRASAGGNTEDKQAALRFCAYTKLKSLEPLVANALRKETDHQVLDAALDAAKTLRSPECTALIDKMDRARSPKLLMVEVIRTLAVLKGPAYADRAIYHLRNGEYGERMAAAEAMPDCLVPTRAISPLLVALHDEELNVRRDACISLGRIASDRSVRYRLPDVIPALIEMLSRDARSPWDTNEALLRICRAQFRDAALPKLDGGLGGDNLAKHALPIWKEWWAQHRKDIAD